MRRPLGYDHRPLSQRPVDAPAAYPSVNRPMKSDTRVACDVCGVEALAATLIHDRDRHGERIKRHKGCQP